MLTCLFEYTLNTVPRKDSIFLLLKPFPSLFTGMIPTCIKYLRHTRASEYETLENWSEAACLHSAGEGLEHKDITSSIMSLQPFQALPALSCCNSAPVWAARGRQRPPGTLVNKQRKVQADPELNCSTGRL